MRQGQVGGAVRPIVAIAVALAVGISVFGRGAAGAVSPPDFDTLLKNRPYLRLFTESNDCQAIRSANQLTGGQLDDRLADLTRWFVHFHSEGSNTWPFGSTCRGTSTTTLAEKLAARGAIVTNYRNGSYVSQATQGQANWGEAEMLERQAPLSISTFWPGNSKPYVAGNDGASGGRLVSSLNAGATTVQVTPVASDQRPAGTPTTWPFVSSRGTGQEPGAYSRNTHDVVSWLRIDDELMQIVGEPTVRVGAIEVPVLRGLWGTAATSHAANARVLSPVYIGSTAAAASDSGLNGAPSRNQTSATLRYGIKIWQPTGWRFIADRIGATFGAPGLQGYNGIWLDVSSCNQYNNADWHGNPVFQWNDAANAKFTREAWGAAQKTKLAGLRSRYPGVWFAGNSLGTNDACTWDLLANAYDGAALEHYMKPGEFNVEWNKQIDQTFRIMAGNWPGMFWARWNYAYTGNVAQYKRFAYGNVLLAYRSGADRYQFGGPFGLNQPDELFRWDLGTPQGAPTGPGDLKIAGTNLYRRDYANAVVLVNPTLNAITYQLDTTLWDVTTKDANGLPKAVASVTVGGYDAAFLLKAATDRVEPTPGASPSASASPSPAPSPTPGNEPPETAISAPTVDAQLPPDSPVVVSGTATDDGGIGGVEVAIRDTATGDWWRSGGTWGNWQGHAATVDAPGSTGTTWSFTWNPPAGGGAFEVRATATDGANVKDASPATRGFTVGSAVTPSVTPSSSPSPTATPGPSPTPTADPVDTTILTPTWNDRVQTGTTLRLTGAATDDHGVAKVGVAIKDSQRGLWFGADGTWGAWNEFSATLAAEGSPTSDWSFTWEPPRDGEYLFVVRAHDGQGNVDVTPAGTKVRATTPRDRKGPKTRIVSFDAGRETASRAIRKIRAIEGVATDDRAVGEVLVAVRDRDTGRWWDGTRRWTRSRRWVEAGLDAGGAWDFPWRVRDGRFRVIARAVDTSGNPDPTPAIRDIRVR
jgi:hypothetical protein